MKCLSMKRKFNEVSGEIQWCTKNSKQKMSDLLKPHLFITYFRLQTLRLMQTGKELGALAIFTHLICSTFKVTYYHVHFC